MADWQQMLQTLIPMAGAALSGNPAAAPGFAGGYAKGRTLYDEMANRKGYLNLAQSRDQYARERDVIEDQRYQEQLKREQAARWIKVLEQVPQLREQAMALAEQSGASTPDLALTHATQTMADWMAALNKFMPGAEDLEPQLLARMSAITPEYASQRFQKAWMEEYQNVIRGMNDSQLAALRANPSPLVSPVSGRTWPFPFAEMEQRLGRAGMPAPRQQAYQSKNVKGVIAQGGGYFEGMANYDPETGKYFTSDGLELRNVKDAPSAPPVTVQLPGELPYKTRTRVDQKVRAYENNQIVKDTQLVAQSIEFVNSLSDTSTNPADDQALIYAFAKAMDPQSVVREGEYATVQKYAQSWLEKFGFDAMRVLMNQQFLTAEARKNLKTTIRTKGGALLKQYQNLRSQYGKQINQITGGADGDSYLIDYGQLLGPSQLSPEATNGGRAALKARLGGR